MLKPWLVKGRKTSNNAPRGSRCGGGCVKPTTAQAHCSVCHETFSRVSNFDRHRKDGWCQDPTTVGLVLHEARVWRGQGPDGAAQERMELRGAFPLPGL